MDDIDFARLICRALHDGEDIEVRVGLNDLVVRAGKAEVVLEGLGFMAESIRPGRRVHIEYPYVE